MAKLFETPGEAAIEPVRRSDWTTLERPYRAFTLRVPRFGEAEADYAIRRHVAGGRKDILSFGEAAGPRSWLTVEIYRPGAEVAGFREPALELAARTAEIGGPYPLTPAAPIDGKFGRMPIFDFTARTSGRTRSCAGFARAFEDPRLQISGWYCHANVEVLDRHTLACAIEGLSLLAAASEPKVQELFARAERRRKFCNLRPPPRGATLRRADWMESRRGPKLRRGVPAR